MSNDRQTARGDFLRMMKWIVVAAVAMVAAALLYLMATGDLTFDLLIMTIFGVFLSVVLGSGLMAASYFSDKSGHDRDVGEATTGRDDP